MPVTTAVSHQPRPAALKASIAAFQAGRLASSTGRSKLCRNANKQRSTRRRLSLICSSEPLRGSIITQVAWALSKRRRHAAKKGRLNALSVEGSSRAYWQLGNLNDAIRVLQLKVPFAFRYSVVYQKLQSSTGSMAIAL